MKLAHFRPFIVSIFLSNALWGFLFIVVFMSFSCSVTQWIVKDESKLRGVIQFRSSDIVSFEADNKDFAFYQISDFCQSEYQEMSRRQFGKLSLDARKSLEKSWGTIYFRCKKRTLDGDPLGGLSSLSPEGSGSVDSENDDQGIIWKGSKLIDKASIAELKKRSKDGRILASLALGYAFLKGEKVEKDFLEAKKFFKRASKKEEAEGFFGLGWLLQYGLGVKKNRKRALKMYRKAKSLGSQNAILQLDSMK